MVTKFYEFWTNGVSIPLINFQLISRSSRHRLEGDELVDPGSWRFVDSNVWFCWMLVHFSHFQWLSRVEVFGPVLHFWWNPLEHTLHLTGTVLERKAAEHLAHFSFELLASARDKPWFKRDFSDAGVERGGELSGDDNECEVADGEEWRWQCQTQVERAYAIPQPINFKIWFLLIKHSLVQRISGKRNIWGTSHVKFSWETDSKFPIFLFMVAILPNMVKIQ